MRLLLDAHFDPAVARTLRERGCAVDAVIEYGPEDYQLSDAQLLARATEAGRVLVTRNIRDFILLHREWMATNRSHAGIVLVHSKTVPEGDRGAEIRALERFVQDAQSGGRLTDRLMWI